MNTYVTMYKCKVCKQLSDAHRPEDLKPNCSEHGRAIEEIKVEVFPKDTDTYIRL